LLAYRELVAAGIMEPVADAEGNAEAGFRFRTDDPGWQTRRLDAAEAHQRALEPPLPQTIALSDAARDVLRKRLAGDDRVTDANRPGYRELAQAGIMVALHSFIGGNESAYRFTDQGWEPRLDLIEQPDPAREPAAAAARTVPDRQTTSSTRAASTGRSHAPAG
jgi:hypothetical protein